MDEAVRMYQCLTLHVEGYLLEGQNRLMRMHWRQRREYLDNVHMLMLSEYTSTTPKPTFKGPVQITIFRAHTGTPLDRDNKVACAKPVLDSLQKLGIIENDTEEIVRELDIVQMRVAHRNGVYFTVLVDGRNPNQLEPEQETSDDQETDR